MLKRTISLLVSVSVMVTLFIFSTVTAKAATSYYDLAMYWAPQLYQDVNSDLNVRADFPTNFNYDGDYLALNNWENLNNYPENGYSYYKVSETDTDYFIEYDHFHARDDAYTEPLDAHENDLEGCIVVVHKDGSTYGAFHILETFAHNQWYQYTNDPAITTGSDNVDGGVLMNGSHPEVYIQPNTQSPYGGHGEHALTAGQQPIGTGGIVYDCTGTAQFPTNTSGSWVNHYGYALIEWGDLWSRRNDPNIFSSYGTIAGDDCTPNSANAPWGWDDSDDGPAYKGMNFSDPAHLIDTHLNGLGNFSHNYIYNPYFTYKVTISTITSEANRDPFGGKSDIYPKFWFNGNYLDQMDRLWKYNDSAIGAQRQVYWGYNDATFPGQYSSAYDTLYVCHIPSNTQVRINVMDSDGTSGDDDMGSVYCTPSLGQTVTFTNAYTDSRQAIINASVTAGNN